MTDILSETYGRELAARTTFEKEAVWLPLLGMHQLNTGDPVIRGKTFTDCMIEGPAVMALVDGVTFDGCNMGVANDPTSLFFKGQGPILIGVIGVADTRFVRCRFVQVGFTGHTAMVDTMAAELVSARAISSADKN
jgi:hypothetical protein